MSCLFKRSSFIFRKAPELTFSVSLHYQKQYFMGVTSHSYLFLKHYIFSFKMIFVITYKFLIYSHNEIIKVPYITLTFFVTYIIHSKKVFLVLSRFSFHTRNREIGEKRQNVQSIKKDCCTQNAKCFLYCLFF